MLVDWRGGFWQRVFFFTHDPHSKEMLAVVLNSDPEWSPSSWGVWIETIMTKKWILGIQQAALVRKNGSLAATSSDMEISTDEILVTTLFIFVTPQLK